MTVQFVGPLGGADVVTMIVENEMTKICSQKQLEITDT